MQSAFNELETRYNDLRNVEIQLQQQIAQYKDELVSRDVEMVNFERQIKRKQAQSSQADLDAMNRSTQITEPIREQDYKINSLQNEIGVLKEKLKDKNRLIRSLKGDTSMNISVEHISPVKSPKSDKKDDKRDLLAKRLDNTQQLLRLKTKELEELHSAHEKRLDRLKSLQANYKLVKEQLKTVEEELHGPKKKKKLKRSHPKALQNEDTDSVWNELAYYRAESQTIMNEKVTLEETLDGMRVQGCQDAATIHELRMNLEEEKDEVQFLKVQLERINQPREECLQELHMVRTKLFSAEERLQKLDSEYQMMVEDKLRLADERKCLKAELNGTKQELAEKRIYIADMKREISRLQREKYGSGHPRRKRKSKKRKVQIHTENQLVEDDWAETESESETETEIDTAATITSETDEYSDTPRTTESLGRSIVKKARKAEGKPLTPRGQMVMSKRQVESVEEHIQRMANKNEPPTRDVMKATDPSKQLEAAVNVLVQRALTRDAATSPLQMKSFKKNQNALAKQCATLKQRLGSLQQQIQALRQSKNSQQKLNEELQQTNDQLQSDLTTANKRLTIVKQNIQKLTQESERLHQQRALLEQQINLRDDCSNTSTDQRSEAEWKNLENRLRVSAGEVSRLSSQVKNLRLDLDGKDEQIRALNEKIHRLERDNSQKRILLDDLRLKCKLAQETANTESQAYENLEMKVKMLTESNEKSKHSVDALRRQLATVTKEKREYEELYLRTKPELEKKNKQYIEQLERAESLEHMFTEVEQTAHEQMRKLAKKSECAIEAADSQLQISKDMIFYFQSFVRAFANQLLANIQHTRTLIRAQPKPKPKTSDIPTVKVESMQKAQDMAKDILNISQSELNDIMNPEENEAMFDSDIHEEIRSDKKWIKKWEKLLTNTDDFSPKLVHLLMDKVEEYVDISRKHRNI